MAGMSSYPFKCDLCGGVTDAPTYGDFDCQHCGQVYVYDECHRIKLSEQQLEALRQMPVIGRLGDQVMKDIVHAFAGVPKWIPVSERLPEDDQQCLTVDKDGVQRVARFDAIGDGERHSWYEEQEWKSVYPVAWMPLPEPTEVE